VASISTMNSQVARRKKASAGGIIRPLLTYALLSFLPPPKESTSSLKERDARARASDPASAAASDLQPRQRGRAKQSGRGRHATSPWQIPWAGWKDILWRTYGQIGDDRLLAVAAGVVFYGLLAIFPAVTAFVSLYGLFAKASTISDHLSLAAGFIPSGGVEIIQEQINRITAKGDARLSLAFAFSLGLALWSANAGMKAVIDALNVTYNEKEKRGFIKLNLISLALTGGAILSLLVALGSIVVLPLMLSSFGLGGWTETLLRFSRWPVLFCLVVFGLAVLYRFGPSRESPRWEWLSVGSVTAAIAWLVGSALLSWYLANFANYDATYGSLGAAIGMMIWMWMSSIVILVGAELNSEIEHQTAQDSTTGHEKPLGQRGAAMADTVGEEAG
jgi:membrane protein